MATKLTNQQLKMLLANMPKLRQSINSIDNTGRALPRPEENPASKEAMAMFMNQLQRKADSQKRYINDAGPAPVYKNVGEKVRAELEREERQRDINASIPNEKFNNWVENVGMPVADATMVADAGLSLPKVLELMGKNIGSKATESLVSRPEKYGLFDLDRTKSLKEIAKSMRENNRMIKIIESDPLLLKKYSKDIDGLKEIAKLKKQIIKNQNPINDITDPQTLSILDDFRLQLNKQDGRQRVMDFMSPSIKKELENPSLAGRSGRQRLPGLVQNSDLTNIKLITDSKESSGGGYYLAAGLNTIGINPKFYKKLLSMGEDGQNILKRVLQHELQHHYSNVLSPNIMDPITFSLKHELKKKSIPELLKNKGGLSNEALDLAVQNRMYFDQDFEKTPMLSELRQHLKDKNFINNHYEQITPDMLGDYYNTYAKNPKLGSDYFINALSNDRISSFIDPTNHNFKILSNNLNKLLGLSGATVGSNALMNVVNKSNKNK